MIAAAKDCSPALVDFLLEKSISPTEQDAIRGYVTTCVQQNVEVNHYIRWNVYHILCASKHCDLLEHFLQKLPRDVSETLLAQQSKDRLNTVRPNNRFNI